jgi:predicted RecA/RadA family phage recombinase
MTTKQVQKGDVLDWPNGGSAVLSNAVIELKHSLGVAITDIGAGETGAVALEGVFELPKVSAAVFAVGEKLIWDTSEKKFDDSAMSPATGDITGAAIAMRAGLNTETTCLVKLTPGNADLA